MKKEIVRTLKRGGVVVMPTDTIYGVVGSALNKYTVERIYRLRNRNPKKPFIILISSLRDLAKFGIKPAVRVKVFLEKVWPGPVSVIVPCPSAKFRYLHRDTKTLAFRIPKDTALRRFLRSTGPLIAPSANIEGYPHAQNVGEAIRYFGNHVDGYVPGMPKRRTSSLLIEIKR